MRTVAARNGRPPVNRAGFSLVELAVILVLLAIMLLSAAPKVDRTVESAVVDRAAGLVALTLERSTTLASRQRRPVTVACVGSVADCPAMTLEVRDCGLPNQLCLSRNFGAGSEFVLDSLTLTQAAVTVWPFGVTSAPLTVTLVKGRSRREVTMSTAGLVRVVR